MTPSAAARGAAARPARIAIPSSRATALVALWLLLALFVVYPLAMLLGAGV